MMTTLSGKWVFDTNCLIYFLDDVSPLHGEAKAIFQLLASDKRAKDKKLFQGVVAQQNILEAEHVLIKQYGRSLKEAANILSFVIDGFHFAVITPLSSTYHRYHTLVQGKTRDLYDLYLAATMLDNDVTNIITANEKDFSEIKGITVYNPWREK